MNKKNIKTIIIIIGCIIYIYVHFGYIYGVYKDATDGVKEMFLENESKILEQEYKLDFGKKGIRAGYYNGNSLVINIGPFFDKESMLSFFEFKNDELYEETLEKCGSGQVRYKQCFGSVYDAYVISTSVELVSETSYRVYIYMCEDLYFMELQKDEVELAETLEIFD